MSKRGQIESLRFEAEQQHAAVCYLCGGEMGTPDETNHPLNPSRDHLVPLVHGGLDIRTNMALCHRVCNVIRGRKVPSRAAARTAALQMSEQRLFAARDMFAARKPTDGYRRVFLPAIEWRIADEHLPTERDTPMYGLDNSPKRLIAGPVKLGDETFAKYRAKSDGRTFWAIDGMQVWRPDERLYDALDRIAALEGSMSETVG